MYTYSVNCTNVTSFLIPLPSPQHLGNPYCNNCYQQNFGPDGFRPGCVEPRKFKMNNDAQSKSEKQEIVSKIREYNLYKEAPLDQLKFREVNNRILFEGVLKIYWGIKNALILAPGAAYAKQRHNRQSIYDFLGVDDGAYLMMLEEASKAQMRRELHDGEKKRLREITENSVLMSSAGLRGAADIGPTSLSQDSYDYLPAPRLEASLSYDPSSSSSSYSSPSHSATAEDIDGTGMSRSLDRRFLRERERSASVIVRKRSASFRKISRQKRKEEISDESKIVKRLFTPPEGSPTNIRLSSTVRSNDVVQMLLSKFKAENDPLLYGLYVVYDSGAQDPVSEKQCPLMVRLRLGPSEDIAKLYIMEKSDARAAQISAEVAEWIKFSLTEMELFCKKYEEEEKKEVEKVIQR
jgi:hypothetical protein